MAKIGIFRDAFVDGQHTMEVPGLNPATPLRLVVTTQAGYGMQITLLDPMDFVVWTDFLEGATLPEMEAWPVRDT